MNENQDERKGLPSASGVEGYKLCPGKHNAEKQFPVEETSDDALIGNRIHKSLETSCADGLNDDEIVIYNTCRFIRDDLVAGFAGDQYSIHFVEERIWDKIGSFEISGKPDELVQIIDQETCSSRVLIIDYKTGRGDVVLAPGNLQLRALAVLASSEYEAKLVRVAIIQPWASPTVSVCDYEEPDLVKARAELIEILSGIAGPNAPRIPGEKQCKYCKAKATCPEASQSLTTVADASIVKSWHSLQPAQKVELFKRCSLAEKVIDSIRSHVKSDLVNGVEIDGLRLKPGATRRSIKYPAAAFAQLSYVVDAKSFAECCTVKIGDLEKRFKDASGLTALEAKRQMMILLDGIIEEKQSEPSVVLEKE